MEEAAYWAEDAIATMLEDMTDYPTVQDPRDWEVPQNAKVVYISVNMDHWLAKNSRSEPRTITWQKSNGSTSPRSLVKH